MNKLYTGSGRVAYRWTDTHSWLDGTTASATFIYGSGLRTTPERRHRCPNCDHLPSYWQFNTGLSHEFANGWNGLPVYSPVRRGQRGRLHLPDPQRQRRRRICVAIRTAARILHGHIAENRESGEDSRCLARLLHQGRSARSPTIGPAPMSAPTSAARSAPASTCSRRLAGARPIRAASLGGLQFGYNYLVAPTWLVGIEAELAWTSAQGKTNFVDPAGTASLSITSDHNWYDTLSGRVGYVMGPLMLYAKGGAAWMNADYQMEVNSGLDGSTLTNTTRPGWIAGGGLEYMLGSRWSAKLEYDHLDFGSNTLGFVNPFGNSVTVQSAVNQVKAGLNYHIEGLL